MDDFRIRVRLFIALVLVLFAGLGMRLAYLQIIDAEEYTGESRQNALREKRVLPARGAIFDRNEILMVDNEPTFNVMVTPRFFDPERTGLLADLLNVSDSLIVHRLADARQWSAFRPSPIVREVPFEAYSRIQENQFMLPGVTFELGQKRRYRTDARAAHALGYVREVTRAELEQRREEGYRQGDRIGKAGLERNFESYLRGRMGSEFKVVNVRGLEVKSYLDGAEDLSPQSGYDLHTSLDSDVQALAESLFVNKRGGAVALDPNNGEIISIVSSPDFDPDIFSRSISSETWDYLNNSPVQPMFNRATMSGMPPGSTWKMFMALMALEEGLIDENTSIYCGGGYRLGGRVFSDFRGQVHGNIRVREALQVSCNTFFFTLMMRTDVNTWAEWARRFGFGRRAPMDITEQSSGLIPDSSYFNRAYPRGWTAGYSINLGVGQGDMVVTPMQLARYVAAIANGGTLHAPHVVRRLHNPETGDVVYPALPEPEDIGVQERHTQVVREGMVQAMERGTGRASQIPGITSGGKTGTAQNPHGQDHSVFVMYAPAEDPQIAVAVLVENAGGGAMAAAPIASLIAEKYLTGEIADTPQRQIRMQRAMNAESEPIRTVRQTTVAP